MSIRESQKGSAKTDDLLQKHVGIGIVKNDLGTTTAKTIAKQSVSGNHDMNNTNLDERIEALRARYRNSAHIKPIDHCQTRKEVSKRNKSLSVEKITIEAPNSATQKQNDDHDEAVRCQAAKPTEYSRGRSHGHKRTVSISFPANRFEFDTNVESPSKQTAKKPRPSTAQALASRRKSCDHQPPARVNQKYTESYKAAMKDTGNILLERDSERATKTLKSKLAVANQREEDRKKRDNSLKKTLQMKKSAHDSVKKEKEKIREKIEQNSQIDAEMNKRKKLLVNYVLKS